MSGAPGQPWEDCRLCAADGAALAARRYPAPGGARGAVVIGAAMATPQRFYSRFAAWLAAEGLEVWTVDVREMGASAGQIAEPAAGQAVPPATLSRWAEQDNEAAVRAALAAMEGTGLPVLYIGHSFGGQSLGLLPSAERLGGAVLVGATHGWWGNWRGWNRWLLALIWEAGARLILPLSGGVPAWMGLGAALPAGAAREWAAWARCPGWLPGVRPEAGARYARLTVPILSISFGDDRFYACREAVLALLRLFPQAPVTALHLEPEAVGRRAVGHWGLFRPDASPVLWELVRDRLLAMAGAVSTQRLS